MIEIGYATKQDLTSWMTLVRSQSYNFPGLETEDSLHEYEITVSNCIEKSEAVCAKDNDTVVGVLLFSKEYNMLCCLAVSPNYRQKGLATQMINIMLKSLDRNKDIIVSTFRENDEKGIAARMLYKKLGFVEDELIEEFGYPCQKFILFANKKPYENF